MKSRIIKKIGKSSFIESFRKPKALLYNVLLDIAIIVVILLLLKLLSVVLSNQLSLSSIINPTLEKILSYASGINRDVSFTDLDLFNLQFIVKLFFKALATLFLFFIIFVLVISAFKSVQWSRILKQKLSRAFFIKFLSTDLIWHLLWLILIIITAFIFKIMISAYLIIIEIILFLYFTAILHSIFSKDKKIFAMMKEAVKIGVLKFYYFLLPVSAIIAIPLALSYLFGFLYSISRWNFLILIAILIILFYLSWSRIYFSLAAGKAASKC
ncbi:MAG: hypothetical protein Q7J54_05560 [Candidatus Woesearchaeota archaeon]|nr:hypothetical protein [Candidatus Woesearchaeota archaeon]